MSVVVLVLACPALPETVARYRAGAAEYICGKYNWDDVVERTLELYR